MKTIKKARIAILGAGNLGLSIAKGIVQNNFASPEELVLTKRSLAHLDDLSLDGFKVSNNNRESVQESDIIILCVQPNQIKTVMSEISNELTEAKILISAITGISIQKILRLIGKEIPVARAMPNTAIAIGESMTCIASTNDLAFSKAQELFNTMGKTLRIGEELMQAATVLGASGIAFFMRYIRAATQGGIQMGFDAKESQLIAMQTAKGAASLVLQQDSHPEVEIDKVTTPQGCTIEGLNAMEHKGFSSALIQGIMVSYEKITKMKEG